VTTTATAASPAELTCYRCGYDLRGLDAGGRCPECAAAIGESLRRRDDALAGRQLPLERADPKWLRTLGRAAGLILLAALLRIGTDVLAIWPTRYMPPAVRIVVFLSPYALMAVGVWLSGAREPVFPAPRGLWLSGLTRVAVIGWFLSTFSFRVLTPRWFDGAFSVGVALSGVLAWCVFWRFRGIIRRGGDLHLADHCAAMGLLVAAACGLWCWGNVNSISELYAVQTGVGSWSVYVPIPVVGPASLLVKFPHSAVAFPRRGDFATFGLGMLMAVPILAMVTLARVRRVLREAAKESDGAV